MSSGYVAYMSGFAMAWLDHAMSGFATGRIRLCDARIRHGKTRPCDARIHHWQDYTMRYGDSFAYEKTPTGFLEGFFIFRFVNFFVSFLRFSLTVGF